MIGKGLKHCWLSSRYLCQGDALSGRDYHRSPNNRSVNQSAPVIWPCETVLAPSTWMIKKTRLATTTTKRNPYQTTHITTQCHIKILQSSELESSEDPLPRYAVWY